MAHIKFDAKTEHDTRAVIIRMRELAAERKILLPKRIRCGGMYGSYGRIDYNRVVVKELAIECVKEKGYTILK